MGPVVVVYESMFGNTRAIAGAIGEGLAGSLGATVPVEVVEVGEAPTSFVFELGLLVIGAPTHGFGLSRPESRADAASKADHPLVSTRRGVREWLDDYRAPVGLDVAVFDTRMVKPRILRITPNAGGALARRVTAMGMHLVAPPEHFPVEGSVGPLLSGEIERAREWGVVLAAALDARSSAPTAASASSSAA